MIGAVRILLGCLLLAVDAAVDPVLRVGELKLMGKLLLNGCDAARVLALENAHLRQS